MPRRAREKSHTGIYHIMFRGINRQQIFEEEEDSRKFIEVLKECKAVSKFKIFAYCLMGNHLHLLIKEENEKLEQIFRRICGRYVLWYNRKYQRVGHLFQDRYKSEPVEDNRYLFTVLRYIHQNPVKAGLCQKVEEYKFSSYNDYLTASKSKFTDTEYILELMTIEKFVEFNNQKNNDKCLDYEEVEIRLTDEQAKAVMNDISKCNNTAEFQALDLKIRNKYLREFRDRGMSIRQTSRLTGVSFGVVRKFWINT